jgi:hypothetical protein
MFARQAILNPKPPEPMPAIRLHLAEEELAAVARFAESLHVKPETIAYAALNRLMLHADNPEIRAEIVETTAWRPENLPLWSDSALSRHAYEGKPDDEPEPSRYI